MLGISSLFYRFYFKITIILIILTPTIDDIFRIHLFISLLALFTFYPPKTTGGIVGRGHETISYPKDTINPYPIFFLIFNYFLFHIFFKKKKGLVYNIFPLLFI